MIKLNRSFQLLELIKSASSHKKNWKDDMMLVLKIGFGIKKKDDQLLTLGNVEENGEIELEQQIYSQEEKDHSESSHYVVIQSPT